VQNSAFRIVAEANRIRRARTSVGRTASEIVVVDVANSGSSTAVPLNSTMMADVITMLKVKCPLRKKGTGLMSL
jgi:hypothetical protein